MCTMWIGQCAYSVVGQHAYSVDRSVCVQCGEVSVPIVGNTAMCRMQTDTIHMLSSLGSAEGQNVYNADRS